MNMNLSQMTKMLGLKDKKDVNMANNIWKMLDDMASSDPTQYQQFIEKNLKQGLEDAKHKKEEKQKPFKVKVTPGFCITMTAALNQKPLQNEVSQKILITKEPWNQVRKKMAGSIKIYLNVSHTDRVKHAVSKSTGKRIQKYSIKTLQDLDLFYYSLQGPIYDGKDVNILYFCIVLNTNFYQDILKQSGNKKGLMGISISYLQERLNLDKNPLLKIYNPEEHRRLAFYSIDKYSIEICEKDYNMAGKYQPQEILLEKEVDARREEELKIEKQKKQKVIEQNKIKPPQIKFRQQKNEQNSKVPQLVISSTPAPQKKKILIQVLKEEQGEIDNNISYEMKETESGYHFQFLLIGISSINEVDLQMKIDSIRLKVKEKKQLTVTLAKPIKEDMIKAKFKKKQGLLIVEAPFR